MTSGGKLRRHQRRQLRVVFDTNALYSGSASDLVRREAADLIKESVFPDLEIQWYLPEVVRHERRYQMQQRALELLPAIAKLEKLLGHNLAVTKQTLVDGVEKAVCQRQEELGLLGLKLDHNKVDWDRVIVDAAYRRPPFKEGGAEKGFRDSLIVECFLQLVADSPKTPQACRVVLVSGDGLVAQAVETRTAGSTNTAVLASLDELKGLINTLISQVDEAFLVSLKPKAQKLFFVPKEKSTLFYKQRVREKLEEKFAAQLAAPPPGATTRENGTWRINSPNFVKKTGQRIQWTSKIEIEAEASKIASQMPAMELPSAEIVIGRTGWGDPRIFAEGPGTVPLSSLSEAAPATLNYYAPLFTSARPVTTHKGVDVYEVLWSADVTIKRELRRASIDEIRHLDTTWEPVT